MTALTSVSPDNPYQDKTAQAQDDSLMRQPPQTPVPGANPMNTSELGANQISKATLQGDQAIASAGGKGGGGKSEGSQIGGALGSIGGTIVGGPIGGAVGGFLGDIFGGLFSEGGPVGYAEGGRVRNSSPAIDDRTSGEMLSDSETMGNQAKQLGDSTSQRIKRMEGSPGNAPFGQPVPDNNGRMPNEKHGGISDPTTNALAAGYLVGALHQAKYGGTPETLHEAANVIKGMLGGEGKGMAQGGPANSDAGGNGNLANEELMKALGMQQPASQVQQPQAQGANTPMQPQQQMPSGGSGGDPNAQRGYAAGGQPGMPPQGQLMGAMPSLPMKSQEHMPYNAQQASQGAMGMPQGQPMGAPQGMPQQASQGLMQQPPGYAAGGPPQTPQDNSQGMGQGFEGDGKVEGPGGPTDDAIPAKLSNGEFVMSSAATQFWGVDKLAKMNDQGKQGFMQKIQQVDAQQQGPNGQPVQAPQADPMSAQGMPGLMQPPMKAAKGGAAVMRTKGSGYCGM